MKLNHYHQKAIEILALTVKGIDREKLNEWIQFAGSSSIKNARYFFFEDYRLADSYDCDGEDLAAAAAYFFPEGNLEDYWESVYTSDGADLEDSEEGDPREFYLGCLDLKEMKYYRVNGYSKKYLFESNDRNKNKLNPDFTSWIG